MQTEQYQLKKYEVFFPNKFVTDHPWGGGDSQIQAYIREENIKNKAKKKKTYSHPNFQDHPEAQASHTFSLNEKSLLMHITHESDATKIIEADSKVDTFKPYEKQFRERYSYVAAAHPSDRIQDHDSYNPIDLKTFPGSFIWWSFNLQLALPATPELSADAGYTLDLKPTYLFQTESVLESIYGNVKFEVLFEDLLHSYKDSFRKAEGDKGTLQILLKKAGTFRYVKEIAYTIIVCAVINDTDPFPGYETMCDAEKAALELQINKPVSSIHYCSPPSSLYYYNTSWDHYIVAFHFKNNDCEMRIPKKKVKLRYCNHDEYHCHSTLSKKSKKCPNDGFESRRLETEIKRRSSLATEHLSPSIVDQLAKRLEKTEI